MLSEEILPDYIDNGLETLEKANQVHEDLNQEPVPTILIQAGKNFGGSLALSQIGYNRPSTNYFNSNLILHQFISCYINENSNHVSFHDKRGKGANTLCNIRIYNLVKLLD